MQNLKIETARLLLRPFTESDAAAASRNSKQPNARRFLSDMIWETEKEAQGFIRWFNAEKHGSGIPHIILAVTLKDNGQCIGFIGIGPKAELDNEIELGFLIAEEHQNKGYATEAGKAMIWWAFEQGKQDVLSAIASPENNASRRVLDKLGFIHGGTRTWDDGGKSDYFRLYHTDYLPNPEWDIHNLYKLEPMSVFFDVRSDGYNEKMLSGSGVEDYKKLGACFPKTNKALNILDIGCGTGIELDYIWTQVPNAQITCVDVSRGMLDLLLKNHPDNHNRITIIKASYIDWIYPENAYDIVVSNMTMHHLWPDEKIGVYREIRNAINPNGCYIEGDFMVDAFAVKQYQRRYEIITSYLPDKAAPGEYHIDIPCSVITQVGLLRDAGFGSVEVLCESINRGNGAILQARK